MSHPPAASSRRRRSTGAHASAAMAVLLVGLAAGAGQQTGAAVAASSTDHQPFVAAATRAPRVPANVRLVRTRTSLLGTHRWYRQIRDGHPVAGGWYARHIDNDGSVTVWDGRRNVSRFEAAQPDVGARQAESTALHNVNATPAQTGRADLWVLPTSSTTDTPRLVWAVDTATGSGAATSYVDAETGNVLRIVEAPMKHTPGRERGLSPNPPTSRLLRASIRALRRRCRTSTGLRPAFGTPPCRRTRLVPLATATIGSNYLSVLVGA